MNQRRVVSSDPPKRQQEDIFGESGEEEDTQRTSEEKNSDNDGDVEEREVNVSKTQLSDEVRLSLEQRFYCNGGINSIGYSLGQEPT